MNAPISLCSTLLVVALIAAPATHGEEYCTSSLIVIGDTTQSPLDEGSINALFTSRFIANVAEKLADQHECETSEVTPAMIRFHYQSAEQGPGRVAVLAMEFDQLPEELIAKIKTNAPDIAREMLVESAHQFFNKAHEFHSQDQREHLDRLTNLSQTLQKKIDALQQLQKDSGYDAIESSDSLKGVYHELTNRQRQDRMKRLAVQAKRESVEKQVEKLTRMLSEQREMMTKQHHAAAQARAEIAKQQELAGSLREKLRRLEAEYQSKRQELETAATEHGDDHPSIAAQKSELEQQRATLHELMKKYREQMSKAAQIESEATQNVHARLQAEQAEMSKSNNQLAQLNQMLTQLAIESDESRAYRQVIEEELDRLQSQIHELENNEAEAKKIDFQMRRLTKQLETVENMRLQLELEAEMPTKREFKIMPWGP